MNKHAYKRNNEPSTLVEDARGVAAVAADVAEERVAQARRRLADALDNAKELAGRARDQAMDYAKATDEALHEHPYRVMGFAFGIGVLLGCLAMRQCRRESE